VRTTLRSALTGDQPLPEALADIESALWSQAVEIPLFQLANELAVGSQVTGVTTGPPFAGPFFAAAGWSLAAAR
jgi:hypothetical protein